MVIDFMLIKGVQTMEMLMRVKTFLLTILLFHVVLPTHVAQSQTTLRKLAGTRWRAAASFRSPPDNLNVEFDYIFMDSGKVRVKFTSVLSGIRPQSRFNVSSGSWELIPEYTVVSVRKGGEEGTYQQKDNSIQITFPSNRINAVFEGEQLAGKITMKSGERSVWSAKRVSGELAGDSRGKSDTSQPSGGSPATRGIEEDLRLVLEPAVSGVERDLMEYLESTELRLGAYEAQISGTDESRVAWHVITSNSSGVIKIKIERIENGYVNANFDLLGMSGELSGRIYDGKLQLEGFGILRGSISETKYQCSITALVRKRTLTEGKYHCEGGYSIIKGTFDTSLFKSNN